MIQHMIARFEVNGGEGVRRTLLPSSCNNRPQKEGWHDSEMMNTERAGAEAGRYRSKPQAIHKLKR